MSPRHFWNRSLQELARNFVQSPEPGQPEGMSNDEFAAFLSRLIGSASGTPVVPQPARPASRPQDDILPPRRRRR